MNNLIVTGTIDSTRALQVMIGAGAKGKSAFYNGLRQALENAVDANCSIFNIVLDKKNNRILFSDDGQGFKKHDLQSFFSLYKSSKILKEDSIGKNGSGRIFLLQIAEMLDVYTKSSDFTQMMNFTLDREYLEGLINTGQQTPSILPIASPNWWVNRKTGTSIELKKIDWKRIPTQRKIIEEFAEYLSPNIAKLVRVNGQKLEPRLIFGEVIEKDFDIKDLGKISIELFFPENGTRGDGIKLGAFNPIISLREIAELSSNPIPIELTGRTISGHILIESINKYRSHDSKSLEDDFYQSEILEDVCNFLKAHVAPLVIEAMARKKTEQEKQRDHAALEDLSKTFHAAFGTPENSGANGNGRGKKNSKSGDKNPLNNSLKLSVSRISICPDDIITINVIGEKKSTKFKWEVSGSSGVLSEKSETTVEFIAKKVGKSTIKVTDSHTNKVGTCTVNIVNADDVFLTPSYVEVETGSAQIFRIITKRKDLKPSWQLESKDLEHKVTQKNAISISCETVGEYKIRLIDSGDPMKVLAESTIKVVAPYNELNNIINIEGHNYLIEASDLPIPAVVERAPKKLNPIAGNSPTIDVLLIDLRHDIIKTNRQLTSSIDAGYNALFPYLIAAHVINQSEKDSEEMSYSFMMEEIARIQTAIMRARRKNSRNN